MTDTEAHVVTDALTLTVTSTGTHTVTGEVAELSSRDKALAETSGPLVRTVLNVGVFDVGPETWVVARKRHRMRKGVRTIKRLIPLERRKRNRKRKRRGGRGKSGGKGERERVEWERKRAGAMGHKGGGIEGAVESGSGSWSDTERGSEIEDGVKSESESGSGRDGIRGGVERWKGRGMGALMPLRHISSLLGMRYNVRGPSLPLAASGLPSLRVFLHSFMTAAFKTVSFKTVRFRAVLFSNVLSFSPVSLKVVLFLSSVLFQIVSALHNLWPVTCDLVM